MAFPSTVLPARFELDLAGDGSFATDITHDVRTRDTVTINRGRPDESSTLEPSTCTLTINNRSGNFSSRNPVGAYYGLIGRNTPLRVSIDQPSSWLVIDAETTTTPAAGCYVTTPDAAALDITGDIDLRFDADLDSWRESMELISKWDTAGNQRSYALMIQSSGKLGLYYSTAGTALAAAGVSTVPVPVTTGRLAVRATMDVNDGFGNRVTTFYTSDTIGGTWTQLGAPITLVGTVSIFAGTAALRILDDPADTELAGSVIRGKVYAAQVRNGIGGTVVANPDFTVQTHGATSFTDSTGKVWTLVGKAILSSHDVRMIGEVSSWPVEWDLSGRDIYSQVEAAGVTRRLSQGASPLKSVLFRAITSLATPAVGYWPCEDDSGATTIATPVAGAIPMHFVGTPSFGADDTFAASESLPTMGDAIFFGYVPTYTSGTSSHQVRFLISVPAAGTTNGAILCRVDCAGTATKWEVVYSTGGGITLNAYDSTGTNILTQGPFVFNMDGVPLRFSISLQQSGSNVLWDMRTARIGVALGNASGTLNSQTVSRVTKVTIGPGRNLGDVTIGHILVQSQITSNSQFLSEMQAYDGESAGRRAQRLCREEGVSFQGFGALDATIVMGPQRPGILMDLLKECQIADMGILGESRSMLGITYRTRESLQNQLPLATVPYGSLASLKPVEDDALVLNDVTASRVDGSSTRDVVTTGGMSVSPPPAGVGRYDAALTVNVSNDGQLGDQAGWRTHLGTVDEARYPTIDVDLAHPTIAGSVSLTAALHILDLGDRIAISNPPAARTAPGDISQLVQGATETIEPKVHRLSLKCSPESPWRVGVYGASSATSGSRYESDGTTLTGALTTSTTIFNVTIASGPLWDAFAAPFLFDIMITGERMTITDINNGSSPQSFTVIRSVNGVVKAHSAGEVVALADPAVYAL